MKIYKTANDTASATATDTSVKVYLRLVDLARRDVALDALHDIIAVADALGDKCPLSLRVEIKKYRESRGNIA